VSARSTFQSLEIRNFRLFFFGQLISQCGSWMQTIALGWLVLDLSNKSGLAVGWSVALQFVPTLLFGVWAGALADRFDKRTLWGITQVALAAVAALLAALDLSGVVQLWMLFVVIFLFGMAFAVDNPTRNALVPELVPASYLPNAIGLTSATMQGSRVFGPALAGVIIVTLGTGMCFLVNAVSFVFVIGALLMMRPAEMERVPLAREKGQAREGLRYMWHDRTLRSTLLVAVVVGTFAINSPVVLPLLAKLTFHGNADVYSWMTIGMGAGAFVGALVYAAHPAATTRVVILGGLGFGVAICAASVAPTLLGFVVLIFFVGAGQTAFLSTTNSLLQLTSEPVMRGRVMAVYAIALLGTTPIGGPTIGWIAEAFGPRWAFAVGGVATLLAVGFLALSSRRAGRRGEQPVGDAAMVGVDAVLGGDGDAVPAIR
jgi:MFS family permease